MRAEHKALASTADEDSSNIFVASDYSDDDYIISDDDYIISDGDHIIISDGDVINDMQNDPFFMYSSEPDLEAGTGKLKSEVLVSPEQVMHFAGRGQGGVATCHSARLRARTLDNQEPRPRDQPCPQQGQPPRRQTYPQQRPALCGWKEEPQEQLQGESAQHQPPTTELPYGVGHERQPPPSGNQPLRAGNNTPIPQGPEGGVKQRALHSPPMRKTLQEVQSMELPHPATPHDTLIFSGGSSEKEASQI